MSSLTRLLRCTFSTASTAQPDSVRKLAVDLYKERNLKRVVEKFKKSCENGRFRSQTGIYEGTVRRLASAGRFRWIEEILEEQKKYKDISKEGFAARLIHLYGKSGMFEQAYKMFDEMPNRGLLSFNALIGACVNAKKFDKVNGFFKELPEKLSIEPDLVSYNTVIKAFCEMGSLDSASLILDEMEKKGVKPDLITFNTLLNGLFKNGKFVDGEKIWGKMLENNVEPDIRSYNAKLLGLVIEKRMEEAVKFVEEMRSKGVKPDVFTFNHMIRGYVNEVKLEEAKGWYGQMGKSDCAPDKLTFTMLVPFLCEKGDLGFAMEVCKEIFLRKRLVGDALLQLVVDELVKASKIEDAKELVKLGKANNFCRYKLNMPTE
ncbi:PREDICTED: pentatricopeptide repeat-containing protein At1g55890, mitochondrial [Theobroma cacao]|uniref:Pentatricopeptide repeat-containing protein At1g55890, mitochondrial n=1 Tax=Theobroma cacao TaxID=3641 RepID=A0AB32WGY0_THECC|nr:PREDICTED: pentatricopeptide repeat-containing protein At1g55890, mitochondrial [Theobroma cacao]